MSLNRYLLNIAYIGKPFRGAQLQVKRESCQPDPLTVQGRLEMALKVLNPCNEPIVVLSSRTDSGVHAINSTCHVDLYRRNGVNYEPKSVTFCLNKYFSAHDVPIRILKTYIVPETFHCRYNAISRTYLYRLIISKDNDTCSRSNNHFNYIPIEEWERSLFLCTDKFDMALMKETAKLFEGYHDYRSFMGKVLDRQKMTRRAIEYIKIINKEKTGYSHYSWPTLIDGPNPQNYVYLDIYMKSAGFLYKQVRRTVASLVAVAQGKVTIRDIKFMLEIPSRHSWCPQIKTLPAHGLYLCEVEYAREDLDTFRSTAEI